MEIFVCIKQVPATNKVRVDEKTGVLLRAGVDSKMNPYDLVALEAALRLKEAHGGRVTVGSMGPPQAEAVIREAYMMGADAGHLFSDPAFGGADVLATSFTLAQAIRNIADFDLILCGKQTTDGDTAQVGPSIAEHLGIPHASYVSGLSTEGPGVLARQQLQDVVQTVWLPFPCLISVEGDLYTPRLPSLKSRREAMRRPVGRMGLSDFIDNDPAHYGLSGSPTQVERIFPPDHRVSRQMWEGPDCAEKLCGWLRKNKFIGQGQTKQ